MGSYTGVYKEISKRFMTLAAQKSCYVSSSEIKHWYHKHNRLSSIGHVLMVLIVENSTKEIGSVKGKGCEKGNSWADTKEFRVQKRIKVIPKNLLVLEKKIASTIIKETCNTSGNFSNVTKEGREKW